jgi:hypothetical protein
MTHSRIAILTGHSLLADGIISRLNEYPDAIDLQIFDKNKPNMLADIKKFQPVVVILEEYGSHDLESYSLKQILNISPSLVIIYLRHGQSKVQILQSGQVPANRVRELLDIIQQSKDHDSFDFHTPETGLSINQLVEIYSGDKSVHTP